jgi:hypothetical protein
VELERALDERLVELEERGEREEREVADSSLAALMPDCVEEDAVLRCDVLFDLSED